MACCMNGVPAFRRFSWLWLPVVLAILARTIVAPGFMLGRSDDGTMTVLICSSISGELQTVEVALGSGGEHDGGAAPEHCPWGALAATPPVPDTPVMAAAPAAPAPPVLPATTLGYAPGIASPLPPSTGPPAFA